MKIENLEEEEERVKKREEEILNTPRLDLIDRNQDPIYAKDTIDGIIKDSLIEIQTSSNNEDDNFYLKKRLVILNIFKKIKDKLKILFKIKTNMTPEHLLEFERYKNRF